METMAIINKAVAMINEHDFFWVYSEYEGGARERSRGHMAAFVGLINNIDTIAREALVNLWMARYEWAKKNMFEIDREALKVYQAKEVEVLTTLAALTSLSMAA
ncbi:hypothetical protein LJC21_04345 [Bacteroides sp. OttesenSCG-928-E20]|nr:hypothetical protein [Bacteroides sp. OttesenSCG-928-E20]MDL2306131.1 hypothetical protein [Bacteroides sp. OttesenSCG-928-D19]